MASRRDKPVTNAVTTPAPTRTSYGSTNGRASPPSGRAAQPKPKPPWCGMCDQQTRLTGPDDAPRRCLNCHPLIERY